MERAMSQNLWNINLEEERNFWSTNIIGTFIKLPNICIYCNTGKICLRKNSSYINPYLGKCNYYKCNREYYLRKDTIFEKHNKTPCSVIYRILDLWLNDQLNAVKITNKLNSIYKINKTNKVYIMGLLQEFRIYIATYLRDKYCLEPLARENQLAHIAVDESLFTHLNGIQLWVIGLINIESNDIRLDIVKERDTNTLKK